MPDISPLVQSLQRFTPDAREDRTFKLAGLEQQQQLTAAQLQQAQATNKRQQILDVANENRIEFIKDKSDIDFVLKDGPEGLRNSLARLAATKDEGDPDLPELVDFANRAVADPDGVFEELKRNLGNVNRGISTIDQILSRLPGTDRPSFSAKSFSEIESWLSNIPMIISVCSSNSTPRYSRASWVVKPLCIIYF